jgi:hypothetical protein
MSSFIGINNVGIWCSNGMRDEFLDWFAEHRCARGDTLWEFCMSDNNRWPGCALDLSNLIPSGQPDSLNLAEDEIEEAKALHPSGFIDLLIIIDQIMQDKWTHRADSMEAQNWRNPIKIDMILGRTKLTD